MAPLPEESTKRYWGVYTVAEDEHRFLVRVANTVDNAAGVAAIEFAWNLIKGTLHTDAVLVGVEVAEDGSNVRNPVTIAAPIPGTGAGPISPIQRPRSWTIKGRSPDGRRVGLSFFGVAQNTPDTWEQAPISIPEFVALRSFLTAQTDTYLSISTTKPVWYNRLTVTYNDHWVDVRRSV